MGGKNNIDEQRKSGTSLSEFFSFVFPLSLIIQNNLPSSSSKSPKIYFLSLEQEAQLYTSISSFQCKQGADVLHSIIPHGFLVRRIRIAISHRKRNAKICEH